MDFITRDSGQRQEWTTGSKRDTQEGKPRYDLIPTEPLRRLADLYARGAEKYGDRNWEKGQPLSRYYASLFRHQQQWAAGETDEDHLAAVIWNAMAIMWTETAVREGGLPLAFADYPVAHTPQSPAASEPSSASASETSGQSP